MSCRIDDTVEGVVVAFLSLILIYLAQQLGVLRRGVQLVRSVSGTISGVPPSDDTLIIPSPSPQSVVTSEEVHPTIGAIIPSLDLPTLSRVHLST